MLSVMPWEKCKDCTWMTTKMRQARIHLWPSLTWTHSALISRWCRSAQRVHQLTPEDSVVEHGWIVLEADWLPAYEANGCECFEVWITEANCLFHMFMSNFIWIFLMCITFTHTHTLHQTKTLHRVQMQTCFHPARLEPTVSKRKKKKVDPTYVEAGRYVTVISHDIRMYCGLFIGPSHTIHFHGWYRSPCCEMEIGNNESVRNWHVRIPRSMWPSVQIWGK